MSLSLEDLQKSVNFVDIKIGSIWYHYKNKSKHYRVIHIGIDVDTDEPVVIYEALYISPPLIFTRSYKSWSEIINSTTHRFTLKE